jgi:DNA-binding Lrp family transcriptional regulator
MTLETARSGAKGGRRDLLEAFVLIQADSDGTPLPQKLLAIPGVLSAEEVSGAFDAIALASAGSAGDLTEGVIAQIRNVPGVTRALPAPLIRSLALQQLSEGPSDRRDEAA